MMKCILIVMIGLSSQNITAMNALAAKQTEIKVKNIIDEGYKAKPEGSGAEQWFHVVSHLIFRVINEGSHIENEFYRQMLNRLPPLPEGQSQYERHIQRTVEDFRRKLLEQSISNMPKRLTMDEENKAIKEANDTFDGWVKLVKSMNESPVGRMGILCAYVEEIVDEPNTPQFLKKIYVNRLVAAYWDLVSAGVRYGATILNQRINSLAEKAEVKWQNPNIQAFKAY